MGEKKPSYRYAMDQAKPILDEQIRNGRTKFGIYTYGQFGKFVRNEILKDIYGLEPAVIIDNKIFDGDQILSLGQAKDRNEGDIVYLICSANLDSYMEIRKAIYDSLPREQIIDLFPKEEEELLEESAVKRTFQMIDSWLEELEPLCI